MILAGLLLVLCYAVVAVICLRAQWDALRELGSETMLAMGFMIIGLLINEVTGVFLAIKHKLAIGYVIIGFLIAELMKAKAPLQRQDRCESAQLADLTKPAANGERSEEHSSAGLLSQSRRLATEKEPETLSGGLADNQGALPAYEIIRARLASVRTECRQWLEHIPRLTAPLQAMARRLEASAAERRKSADAGATGKREISAVGREEERRLEARIVDLERELAVGKGVRQMCEEIQERVREIERVCRELVEGQRRLCTEISSCRERLAAGEESRREVSALCQQVYELKVKQARFIDEQRSARNPFTVSAEPVVRSPAFFGVNRSRVSQAGTNAGAEVAAGKSTLSAANVRKRRLSMIVMSGTKSPGDRRRKVRGELLRLGSRDWEPAGNRLAPRSIRRQWRVGMLAAALVVVAGAVISGGLDRRDSAPKELALAPATHLPQVSAAGVSAPRKKPAARLQGTFQTVRPTQIYDGPSENAALIGDIGAGIRLNVVDSTYGWLEVRSRHGRPPGFVRQEAAVRISWN